MSVVPQFVLFAHCAHLVATDSDVDIDLSG